MNTLVWRLHYKQVYFALAALVALCIVLLITGVNMAHDYNTFMANCRATQTCGDASSQLFRGDGAIMDLVDATVVVPLLFGLFWGAPMLSKEYEDGTQNLVWTQGVTRRRWLSTNIMWVFLAAVVWAGAMATLVSWWRGPENALDTRFNTFDIQGIVPVAYAIFAVALGIAVGSIFKRVLPAVATTLGTFVAFRVVIAQYVRQHYMTPVTKLLPFARGGSGAPPGSFIISTVLVGPGGQSYGNGISPSDIPAVCRTGSFGGKGISLPCMVSHGFKQLVTYQPASRFWAFQGIEAALFIVIAAALLVLACRMVLTRDA